MTLTPSRRTFLVKGGLGLASLSLLDVLAACGGSSTGGTKQDHLAVGIVQEPTSLDPTLDATASISTLLRDNVYEGLVRLDPAGKVEPGLATWDLSSDGRVYTFHLHQGVKWHDGTPLTADDVKFSYDRAKSGTPPNPHKDYWAPVQSVDVVDPKTVRVTLSTYSFNFLFHMGAGSAAIVSQKTASTNATKAIGTGPFKFQSWNRGASLTLVRNDDYWGRKAQIRQITFRFITDPNAMNNALKAGDLDAIAQVQGTEQLSSFQSNSRFKVLKGQPVGKVLVTFNNASGALRDVRVRRAITLAIDRSAWVQGIYNGYAVPIGSHACPNDGEPYYVDETGVNKHDPAQAKKLLQDAGYGGGLTLRLAPISDFPYSTRGADILASELKDVGITLQQQPVRFADWLSKIFGGAQDFDLTIVNHVEERDIGNYANPKYYWHYSNPDVTRWLAQADAEQDEKTRKGLYSKIQHQLAVDCVNGWTVSPSSLGIIRADLEGYPPSSVAPSLYLANAHF
jgi:peptide/nickel transport system substrate-binding protein